jgi:electron transport complex protein RnfE
MSDYNKIIADGLWKNNPATVQLLGLCPLLAVTSTVVNALGLGLATILVLVISNITVSLIRNIVRPEIRIPVFVLVIASAVTITDIIMQAFFYELYLIIGLFIALITTNCAIIARAEAFASKNTVADSALDGLFMGLGFTAVLLLLGTMREIIGFGTLFQQFDLMFGEGAQWMKITLFENYDGYLLAILPPGAFIGLGLIIAFKNVIDKKREQAVTGILQQSAT